MSAPVLHSERRGCARLLTVDREGAGNSISREVTAAIEAALDATAAEPDLRAVVITGAGERFFSTGGDIKQYRALTTRDALDAAFERPRRLMERIETLGLPVIAAVNGWALGGGSELMLACDIRLAARSARIGFPYVRLGLMPGWHGTERLLRACGYAAAMRLLVSGEPVGAEEAHRLGLVSAVVEDGTVVEEALALAEAFASAAPLSVGAIKRTLHAAAHLPHEAARRVADEAFAALWLSEDHREAEAAFAEKRAPGFRGR